MKPLVVILIFWVAIFAKQIWDWYLIERQKVSPDHTKEGWIMFGVAVLHLLLSWIGNSWWYVLNLTVFDFCSYVALFDGGLNLMRKKKFLYIGSTAKIDSNLWQKHPELYKWSKIISGTLAIASGVLIFIL